MFLGLGPQGLANNAVLQAHFEMGYFRSHLVALTRDTAEGCYEETAHKLENGKTAVFMLTQSGEQSHGSK